jgi:hypothetical protein
VTAEHDPGHRDQIGLEPFSARFAKFAKVPIADLKMESGNDFPLTSSANFCSPAGAPVALTSRVPSSGSTRFIRRVDLESQPFAGTS